MDLRLVSLWNAFSRVNPYLPPSRKASKAERWARTADHVAGWILGKSRDDLRKWAAYVHLDLSSKILLPSDYTVYGDGSLRRQARDNGGIEGVLLLKVVETVLMLPPVPNIQTLASWEILYPNTASLGLLGVEIDKAISEWKLIPDEQTVQ